MPPPTVRLGVTRNLHALVSPKRRPTQTHYEVDTFMVERMTLRIPVAACAEAQRQASTAAAEDTPAARLLAGLPALANEAKPDALTSVPLTAKDPNERQVLQPVDLPLAAFLQAVDAPATAHTVVDGANALDRRDGWMANVMRVATDPPAPLRAPKVSPRKKKTSPRRRKKKGKDKAPTQREPAPSSTTPLVVRHPSPPPARPPTLPPVDTVSKAAYRRLEAENGRLRRALAQARERRTPPTTPPPPRRDHGVQTDAPASTTSTTPPPPTVVVVETPRAARAEAEAAAEASLAERIVRKERLEARRQVRALLGCGEGNEVEEDEDEAEEGEENTMVDSETVSDTASDASSTTPPPTPPPPVPPPPVPPPPVPPPPVPPPPLAPPPLLKRDSLAALTPTLPPVAAAA